MKIYKYLVSIIIIAIVSSCIVNRSSNEVDENDDQQVVITNEDASGPWITLDFKRGESFYYPLIVVWLEDMEGNYIQSLYVPTSVATSVFRFGEVKDREWQPGVRRYPQTVPYWAHKRNIVASDGLYMPDEKTPVPDAISGATPITGFILHARSDRPITSEVKVMLEVNQNWDWNEYWTNDLYPDDEYYKRSCQPALVYEGVINPSFPGLPVLMKPIGHSHHSGATGELFPDLSTITTALHIADSITVRLGR